MICNVGFQNKTGILTDIWVVSSHPMFWSPWVFLMIFLFYFYQFMIFMTSWFVFQNILLARLLYSSSKCTVENFTAHMWENELLKAHNMLALSQKLVHFTDSLKVSQGVPEAQALRVKLLYPFFLYIVYSHLLPLPLSDLLSIHNVHVTLLPHFRIFANFYSSFSKVLV